MLETMLFSARAVAEDRWSQDMQLTYPEPGRLPRAGFAACGGNHYCFLLPLFALSLFRSPSSFLLLLSGKVYQDVLRDTIFSGLGPYPFNVAFSPFLVEIIRHEITTGNTYFPQSKKKKERKKKELKREKCSTVVYGLSLSVC